MQMSLAWALGVSNAVGRRRLLATSEIETNERFSHRHGNGQAESTSRRISGRGF